MDRYPGKTVVPTDIDCRVYGDIRPVIEIGTADVGITVLVRNMRKGQKFRHWLAVECSSRVVVFRPTQGARGSTARPCNW